MKAIVGMSGGVDSSVAALLLKEQGHDVTGVTMRLWREGKYAGGARNACFSPNEGAMVAAAADACRAIGIPHRNFDCFDDYDRLVIAAFREEHLAGRTPNPCVLCNALLKCGLLPEAARRDGVEFDHFATGHYARTDFTGGRYRLLRAADSHKDQSYFLYRLSQAQLARHLFPLGEMTKGEVREIARSRGLLAADRPDSQDFYSGDRNELIGEPDRPGSFVDSEGKVLGKHSGFWKYTVGQRKGIGIAAAHPLYVIGLDACRNEVVLGTVDEVQFHSLVAGGLNWVSEAAPEFETEVQIKVRSAGDPIEGVTINMLPDGRVGARFPGGIAGVAPGQSAVFYRGDAVVGGGIIEERS